MSDIKIKLVKDIQDLSDGSILAPAGTIANFVSDEGDYIIAALIDGSVSFPIDPDEYLYLYDVDKARNLTVKFTYGKDDPNPHITTLAQLFADNPDMILEDPEWPELLTNMIEQGQTYVGGGGGLAEYQIAPYKE